MTATILLPGFAFPAKALDRPLLIKSVLLSLLLHIVVVVVFGEVVGTGDDGGSIPGTAALAVRLKLRWTKPEVAETPAASHLSAPRSPAKSMSLPQVSAYSSPRAVDALPESAPETAALPLPRIVAEPLARIEAPTMRVLPQDAAPLAEPPPLPRIAAEPLARIEAPTMRVVPPDAPRLPEPSPLPRIAAEPLARIEATPMRVLPQDAAPLAEPPPLPRIEAEALAPVAPTPAAAMRPAPQDAAPLAEPPPLPRIEAEALAPVAPTPAAAMRPAPQDAAPFAAPRGFSAVAPPPDEAQPARGGPAPAGPTAPGVVASPPGPARLDFGPRRSVDPDLAALVGESVPEAPPSNQPAGLDIDATRALARNLHRAPAATRPGRPLDLSVPKPDAESTLGRAIGKAAQPDCRVAYAGLGLLGVPFLLFDTLTDTGCRW